MKSPGTPALIPLSFGIRNSNFRFRIFCLALLLASFVIPHSSFAAEPNVITATHLDVRETRKEAAATTPAFRIPANHLALIWVAIDNWHNVGEATGVADSARKWTKVASQNARSKGMTLWQSLEPVATNSAVSIQHNGPTRVNYVVNCYSATTVRQSATAVFSAETTSGSVTFEAKGSGGAVAAAFIRSATEVPPLKATPGPGFEFVGGEAVGVELINRSEFSPQFKPEAIMSWTGRSGWIGIAVEIGGPVPASGTPPTKPAPPKGGTPRAP